MRQLETDNPSVDTASREAAQRCLVAIVEDDTEFRNMLRELLEEEHPSTRNIACRPPHQPGGRCGGPRRA